LFITAISLLLAMGRWAGPLLPGFALGILAIATVVILRRVENMIVGGVYGAGLAALTLIVLYVVQAFPSQGAVLAAWLCYPPMGYVVGTACAAERSFRAG
jgi:hypothetical protein